MALLSRAKTAALATVAVLVAGLLAGSVQSASAAGAASISGAVQTTSGDAIPGAWVTLYDQRAWGWGYVEGLEADASGGFSFDGLDAGSYTLAFSPAQGQNFLAEWWEDKPSEATATAIVLGVDEALTGRVAQLTAGATISGTLTAPLLSGGPESLAACADGGVSGAFACDFDVDADGSYRIAGLPAGTYTVAFGGQGGCGEAPVGAEFVFTCRREVFWNSSPGLASATTLALAHQEQRTGVDQNFDIAAGVSIYPKITGTGAVGKTLTAASGSWEPGTPVLFQWYADDAPISGATAAKFTVTAAQLGKTLTAHLYGLTHPASTPAAYDRWENTSWTMSSPIAAGTLAGATPTITGSVAVGSKLTVKPGTWTSGTAFRYRWYANGVAISAATAPTFTLTTAQKGKTITVKVAGLKAGYTTLTKSSAATKKVATAATPTISGTVRVGSKLTAKPGVWTTGTAFRYQWYANGTAIRGATASTFTLTSAQRGKTITVKVAGVKSGYATVTKVSRSTAAVR